MSSKKANPNTEYEKLVADIHQGIIRSDGYDSIKVEHNVTLTGKSGASHQIDVYWEFKLGETTYRTCIECKNYNSAVKKSHVAAFAETLRDIGNANGIIATTIAFQKGAQLLAKENNIRLVLVNYLLKSIRTVMQPRVSNYVNTKVNFNKASQREALIRNGLKKFETEFIIDDTNCFRDSNGNPKITPWEIVRSHQKEEGSNIIELDELYVEMEVLGLVKVDSIEFTLTYSQLPAYETTYESPNSAKAIIEDIVTSNIHYIHDDGSVNKEINNV